MPGTEAWKTRFDRAENGRVGDDHPLTVKIEASMILCFAEQLDWTLDDFPADLREWAVWSLSSRA